MPNAQPSAWSGGALRSATISVPAVTQAMPSAIAQVIASPSTSTEATAAMTGALPRMTG